MRHHLRGGERAIVYPDDLLRYAEVWDKKLAEAFPKMTRVAQPLQAFLEQDVLEILEDIRQGKAGMLSIRTCYYEGARTS